MVRRSSREARRAEPGAPLKRLRAVVQTGDVAITIETARLVLRMPRPDDADAFAEYLADPEVMRFLGGETVPREDVPAVVEKWLGRWKANGCGPFAITRREDGRVIGRAGIIVWDTRDWRNSTWLDAGDHAQPELGWALGREHW